MSIKSTKFNPPHLSTNIIPRNAVYAYKILSMPTNKLLATEMPPKHKLRPHKYWLSKGRRVIYGNCTPIR